MYQPLYETYSEGDIVLDREGNPIPLMERVYEYEDRTETYETDKPEPVSAVYDWATDTMRSCGEYHRLEGQDGAGIYGIPGSDKREDH